MTRKIENAFLTILFITLIVFKDNIYFLLTKTALNPFTNINEYYDTKIKDDYNDLLNTIDIVNPNNYKYIYSKVLFRDIYDFKNEITILKGSDDNLKENMAIINQNGFVGVITKVTKDSSVVRLITNNKSKISNKINDSYGILQFKNSKLIITGITNDVQININDSVYTSGIGNLPKDIYVGYVKEVNNNNLEKEITITSLVNFDTINFVIVIEDQSWFI